MWASISRCSVRVMWYQKSHQAFNPRCLQTVVHARKGAPSRQAVGFETFLRDVIMSQEVVDWNHIRDKEFPKVFAENCFQYPFNGSFATAVFLSLTEPETLGRLCEFVRHVGYENLSSTLLAKYMMFSTDSEEILRCWKVISARSAIFPRNDLSNIVLGLLKTPEWREALKFVVQTKTMSDQQVAISNAVLKKLFQMKQDDEAYAFMDSLSSHIIVSNFVDDCVQDSGRAQRLLRYMKKNTLFLDDKVSYEQSRSWNTQFQLKRVKIGNSSQCPQCQHVLPAGSLTDDEFSELRTFSLNSVVNQEDIYLSSTPQELASFRKFMQAKGPFDVAIDGLNLAYSKRFPKEQIESTCREYGKRGLTRIMIMLRQHLLSLYKNVNLPPGAILYAVRNCSKDDPFLLLAALESHKDCRILSSDFFRDHLHKMKLSNAANSNSNSNVAKLFEKWLSTRKDDLCYPKIKNSRNFANVGILALAPKHFMEPYEDDRGWHVPLKLKTGDQPQWICLRYRNHRLGNK